MRWMKRIFGRRRMYGELTEEIRAHLEEKVAELVAGGMTRKNAEAAARREFGNVTLTEEEGRDVWRWMVIENFLLDVRYCVRGLRKSLGFTAVVVLTLALGIGANSAVFSVVNAVLLRPLPYPDAERITRLGSVDMAGANSDELTMPQFIFLRDNTSQVFEELAGYRGFGTVALEQGKKVDWVEALAVTDGFLKVLGTRPAMGRDISRAEINPGSSRSAILSDGLWHRSFAANPDVIGARIKLDDEEYTVVGVLPSDFKFVEQPADVFVPLQTGTNLANTGINTPVIGRLRAGVNAAQVEGQLNLLYAQLPDRSGRRGLTFASYQRVLVGDVRPSLLVLFGAAGLLLLIACANVASLILARAGTRARETAMRLALGAGRGRLLQQLLVESLLLALIGAGVGLLGALWTVRSLAPSIPWDLAAHVGAVGIDAQVLAVTLGAAVLTSVVFGVASFAQASRMNVNEALKGGKQAPSSGFRGRNVLVIGEVALSVALLVGAALLGETLYHLRSEKLGFDPTDVVSMETPFPRVRPISAARIWSFDQGLLERIQTLPGVASAALVSVLPLDSQGNLPTQVAGNNDSRHSIGGMEIRSVSGQYFKTMRIPLLQGRELIDTDVTGTQPVAVISESVARRWWPDQSPLGQQIVIGKYQGREYLDPPDPARTVVGVAADVKGRLMGAPAPPMVYLPAAQNTTVLQGGSTVWVIRTTPKFDIGPELRQAVTNFDAEQRIASLRSMSEVIGRSVGRESFNALIVGVFAALALALASVGIYGVLSLFVNHRTREIGIRMALGAKRAQVLGLVVGQGMLLAAAGIGLGGGMAFGLARLLRGLLFGVQPTSLGPYGAAVLLLGTVALAACYLPARRAMRVDPMAALRYE